MSKELNKKFWDKYYKENKDDKFPKRISDPVLCDDIIDFINEEKKEYFKEIIREIDNIEMEHGNTTINETTINEWKLYKHIRNGLRDKFKK